MDCLGLVSEGHGWALWDVWTQGRLWSAIGAGIGQCGRDLKIQICLGVTMSDHWVFWTSQSMTGQAMSTWSVL